MVSWASISQVTWCLLLTHHHINGFMFMFSRHSLLSLFYIFVGMVTTFASLVQGMYVKGHKSQELASFPSFFFFFFFLSR